MNYVKYLREMVGHNPVILVGSVVIALNDNKEILLQKRGTTSYGSWGLPGGLMEMKETTEDTARREVFEETGIEIGELKLEEIVSGEDNYLKLNNSDEFYAVSIVYSTQELKGELKPDMEETLDARFFELKNLPDRMVGSHRRMVEKFIAALEL